MRKITDKIEKYQRSVHLLQHLFIRCSIHENCFSISPIIVSIHMVQYLFIIHQAIVRLLIRSAIFHPARQIFNVLNQT